MSGPLFWTEYTDDDNKYSTHQAAVIALDMQNEEALILVPGKARAVKKIPFDKIRWARWD